jgi:ADP-heptose:LPS heptosyltransferase
MKTGRAAPDELQRLSRQIAHSFMDAYLKDCHYEKDYINLLCEMTTYWPDHHLNGLAAQALFTIIIESLCDDFEDLQTETYNRVMAQVISFCRNLPTGSNLDNRLKRFGLISDADLQSRIKKLRADGNRILQPQMLKKIILLSRVTIGADVAVTSIIIQRLARICPDAAIILVGDQKLKEIYGGNSRIEIKVVKYDRQAGLLERLTSWQTVLDIVQNELDACPLEHTILVDPDSRLSQLGILPLIAENHYYFFDSRSDASFDSRMSMAELTNSWLDRITGTDVFCYPKIWPHEDHTHRAIGFCNNLRKNGARRLIAVNLGVGGNPRKKLTFHFEKALLQSLLREPETVILFDKGSGDDELHDSISLLNSMQKSGYVVQHCVLDANLDSGITSGLIGLQTRIGEIAAIIANCDEYIGYDSACQHIAAAVETPCLTIFAGSNNMRFIRRWSAFGPNSCQIVHVDTLRNPSAIDAEDIIIRILNERSVRSL